MFNIRQFLLIYIQGYSANIIVHFVYRLVLLYEERTHLKSRYNNSYINLLKDAFTISKSALFLIIICIIYNVYYYSSGHSFTNYCPKKFNAFLLVLNSYLIGKLADLSYCPLNDSLLIGKMNSLDYGSGMAYSFFYGYLNLILKNTGTEEKNLVELMANYEAKNNVKFEVYKLFILIPVSFKCFVSLKNENSPSIDESSSLADKIKTVAGVKDRVYRNSVYKIISDKNNKKKNHYISAEYATPLKTFKDVLEQTGNQYFNRNKKEISLHFYLTLKKILRVTGLDAHCEPIYYEDSYVDPNDNQVKYHDVGKILLSRVRELKKYQKEKVE